MYHILPLTSMLLVNRAHLFVPYYKLCLFNRNIVGAIRVGAGRDSIEPGLAEKLTYRNHELDDLFTAETLFCNKRRRRRVMNPVKVTVVMMS